MAFQSGPVERYTISRSETSMVKYIERNLLATDLWSDWIVLKTLLLSFTGKVVKRTGVTKTRAYLMIWNAFAASVEGDSRSPVFHEFTRITTSIPADLRPIFLARIMIAVDIHKGATPKVAEEKFLEWLSLDDNAIFGNHRLLDDFTTEALE
jgi:hypothetical protein